MKTEAIRILNQFKEYISNDSQWLTSNDIDQMMLKTDSFIQYINSKYDKVQQKDVEENN